MKNTIYAIAAATLAMIATSGLFALTTNETAPESLISEINPADIDSLLNSHLDHVVAIHLNRAKISLMGTTNP